MVETPGKLGLDLLKEQLLVSKVILKKDYRYIINPITEQEPPLNPSILEDCANRLIAKMEYKNANKILTAETMGVPIATVISLKTGIPLIIATKRNKRVSEEYAIVYKTGYEDGYLHFNSISPGDNVLIIDDVISTGGTILCMIQAVKQYGANVVDIGAIMNKLDYGGLEVLRQNNFYPKTLINIRLNGLQVEIEDVW